MQFKRHYTVAQARALLPQVRQSLTELNRLRRQIARDEERLAQRLAFGDDLGGPMVNDHLRHLAHLQRVLAWFSAREILIKDPDRGLIDFPALRGGREIFLCWEQDEDDIEYWHELDTGFAGREKLPEEG